MRESDATLLFNGAGSVIGGNVWLTHSVPPGTRVYQVEAKQSHFESGAGI